MTTRIDALKAQLARKQQAQGWNETNDIYNRDWKKEIAALKRQIKELETKR